MDYDKGLSKITKSKIKSHYVICQCQWYDEILENYHPFFIGSGLPKKYLTKEKQITTGKI